MFTDPKGPLLVVSPVVLDPFGESLLDDFEGWLVQQRGLSEVTARNYTGLVRLFMASLAVPVSDVISGLDAAAVLSFVMDYCRGRNPVTVKAFARSFRSFLRFVHATGMSGVELAGAVPHVACWHQASVPKTIPLDQVERVVRFAAFGRCTPSGRRDYAIVLLIVRLGLRCVEVSRLMLDNIDWRAGEIMVTGKGGQQDRLPLPVDVGEAVSGWLVEGRPSCDVRTVFTSLTPVPRSMTPSSVRTVVRVTSRWAGIPGGLGAHRFRHTLATQMLRAGASLPEVGQVLRHQSYRSTVIYAKVNELTLRPLAMPWPVGVGHPGLTELVHQWPAVSR